eukprot:CAMPEP_0198154698 /NCGR_PEP_ID=MMETSP1443-20131203/68740_1 /TAXON_ID=186043 /ORGANISM="Entomoneis sp., Strain CCMP2396" /LENGTH=302 /DNA_ID=CAMNT_0043821397 /DNA_START=134 /DNA_END=1040 /DNA_ORIENTATION=-
MNSEETKTQAQARRMVQAEKRHLAAVRVAKTTSIHQNDIMGGDKENNAQVKSEESETENITVMTRAQKRLLAASRAGNENAKLTTKKATKTVLKSKRKVQPKASKGETPVSPISVESTVEDSASVSEKATVIEAITREPEAVTNSQESEKDVDVGKESEKDANVRKESEKDADVEEETQKDEEKATVIEAITREPEAVTKIQESEKDIDVGKESEKDADVEEETEKDADVGKESEKDADVGEATERDLGVGEVKHECEGSAIGGEEEHCKVPATKAGIPATILAFAMYFGLLFHVWKESQLL